MTTYISLFLVSLCQRWGAARNFFSASSDSLFHPPLSLVFFFRSSSSPAFLTSLLTQSSHLSLGLPRLLLPCSRNPTALFGSLSSAILSTCPAHCNLLLTSVSVKLLCTPVTLDIFRTELFSHTCSLCCCSSVSAKIYNFKIWNSTTQAVGFDTYNLILLPKFLIVRSFLRSLTSMSLLVRPSTASGWTTITMLFSSNTFLHSRTRNFS